MFDRLGLLCIVYALLAAGCGSAAVPKPAPEPPRVSAWKPGDELERLDQALEVSFSEDMVGIEAVGPTLSELPVRIEPARPLRVHWQDRRTLIVAPETEWQPGERYTATLLAPLVSQLTGPTHFVFDALPLRIQGTSLPRRNADLSPSFHVYFSLPVEREAAATHCALVGPSEVRMPLSLVPLETYEGPHSVRLKPQQPLLLATHYMLRCDGLKPLAGAAPVRAEPAAVSFMTHGLLSVDGTWPKAQPAQPPERAELCLAFSTPVELKQLAAHVHVTPAPEGLADSWYEYPCIPYDEAAEDQSLDTHRKSSLLLAANRHYRVEVDAELQDQFGQTLGQAHKYEFTTADRIPGLWTATGTGIVLERGRKEHALGTLNLDSVSAQCLPLTAAKYAGAQQSLFAWSRYTYDSAADPALSPWQLMGETPRVTALSTAAPANTAKNLPLDLAALCGARSGAPGVYALELQPRAASLATLGRQGDDPARAVVNVTDLAVVAKRGARQALVWVTKLSSGALVPKADVTLIDAQGRSLAKAQTDQHGLARLSSLPAPGESELFEVRAGDDVAVVGSEYNYQEGLRPFQLDVREGDDQPVQMFVHTDRGVYKPGERVYVHGLVRELSDTAPARVPTQRAVKLRLHDERQTLLTRALTLSDFGSFASQLDLPAELTPGEYALEVELGQRAENFPIHVAEFRPLTFELTGALAKPEVFAEGKVELALRAQYLFGTPLSGAQVTFTVERTLARIRPAGLEAFNFSDFAPLLPDEAPWPDYPDGLLSETSEEADAEGRTAFSFATEASALPLQYTITASASDAAQDRATRVFSLTSHSGDRYPGVRMTRSVYAESELPEAQVVLVDRHGKPVAGNVDAELRRVHWDCADPIEHCRAQVEVIERKRVAVGSATPAAVSFSKSGFGSLHVRITAVDSRGRRARASDVAYVWTDQGEEPYEDKIAAPLEVDKRSYQVGERARLALRTALDPQHWLLTAERGDVLHAEVLSRRSGMPELLLDSANAPNVFVGLLGMVPRFAPGERGKPRLVAGMRELPVQGESRALSAQITTAKPRYEPGERVTGEISVKHLGRALGAEVALAVVNESVLQLTGFATPDPKQVFHAPRGLTVRSYSNFPLIVGDPAAAASVPETAHIGPEGEDGPGGRPDVRNDYVAAAYIAPDLRTDERGMVKFDFPAPSDLSAYRMMVVAAAKDDRVGSADARITVAQQLSARVIAPDFLSSGDRIDLGVLVHDNTEAAGQVAIQLTGEGVELAHSQAQVTAAGSGSAFRTEALVQAVDQARFEVELHKGAASDRVRRELQVRRPTDTDKRVLLHGRQQKAEVQVSFPPGLDAQKSRLELSIDRAGLAPLAPALAQLIDYPYGCTEQTAAALLALAHVPELASAVVPGLAQRAQLEEHIQQGLVRLRAARTTDGHYGLYPGMHGRPWLSALVLESLLALRTARFSVPEPPVTELVALLTQWLNEQALAKQAAADLEESAHVIWLLSEAGAVPAAALDQLLAPERRASLSADARAYALHAAAIAKRPEAQRAPLRAELVKLDLGERERDPLRPFSSTERTNALVLSALQRDGGAAERCSELASWLSERAADPERMLSTRDSAETLRALASWARSRQAGAQRLRVGLDKRVLYQGTLTGAQVFATQLPAAAAQGKLWIEADGDVTYSVRRVDIAPSAPKPAFAHGLTLDRRYLTVRSDAALDSVGLSDVVQVELTLRTQRAVRMLVVTDPLPGGFTPLDPGLSSGRFAGCDRCESNPGFDFVRRRQDRIEAFAEWLPAGTHRVRYLVRATSAGEFSAPGADASLMYLPDVFARSAVSRVKVGKPGP
jgi:alpha-2-macroglobulin